MVKITYQVSNNKRINMDPTRVILFSFLAAILLGTMLLSLPAASRDSQSVGLLTALFTATSATCVTGLVVVDTLTQWSTFGQLVILFLIQIGGLGLVTLATFFSILIGKKVSMKGMILAQESINHFNFQGILKLIKRVVLVTFGIELLGALILSTAFVPKFGLKGFYMGVFHSISAFCNAGFDIMGSSNSFIGYNNNPIIIYTFAALVVVGGLGFIVWKDIYEYKTNKKLLLHTKVVLTLSLILLVFGFIFFLSFEFNNPDTMKGLSLFEKINSAVHHTVNTRTAGFSTLPLGSMKQISKVVTIFLMFIGAAPGSTAGGIKITTFGVLLIAVFSQIKGSNDIIIFKHKVPYQIVLKALSIVVIGLLVVITVTTIILAIEGGNFIDILFEVSSAFATVGLSTGITPTLHPISKILLILTMFWGRVGPLTFAIALSLKDTKKSDDIIYPDGKIVVG